MKTIVNIKFLFVVAAVCSLDASHLYAQSHPSMGVRQRLVDSLNASVLRGDSIVSIGSDTVELANALGECDTLESGEIKLSYSDDLITLCRKLRDQDTNELDESHRLADDLNNWLNAVWAMELQDRPEFDTLRIDTSLCNWPYHTDTTNIQALIDTVKEISGENAILATMYDINGTMMLGSSFITFEKYSPRPLWYIIDTLRHKKYLASSYVQVVCGGDTFRFEHRIETLPYDDGCGVYQFRTYGSFKLVVNGESFGNLFPGDTSNLGAVTVLNDSLIDRYSRNTVGWQYTATDNDKTDTLGMFAVDSVGYLIFMLNESWFKQGVNRRIWWLCQVLDPITPAEYCCIDLCEDGEFSLDTLTGKIIYIPPPLSECGSCESQPIPCLEFCDDPPRTPSEISSVITINAATYSRDWSSMSWITRITDFACPPPPTGGTNAPWRARMVPNPNVFEKGQRRWGIKDSYAYRSSIQGGSALFGDADERNYSDAGVFTATQFNWQDETLNDTTAWLRMSTATAMSPNGEVLEERDILGIYSTALFDGAGEQPSLVAQNAKFGSVYFDSFESGCGTTAFKHSGIQSLPLPDTADHVLLIYRDTIPQQWYADGILIRLWVKRSYHTGLVGTVPVRMALEFSPDYLSLDTIRKIGQSGEWVLYEAVARDISVLTGIGYDFHIASNLLGDTVWVDDLAIQPLYSQMICYVYDPATYRLVTQFDDQHFGIYYQYNGEGKLVRKIRETERGFKTIQEAQYHTPALDSLVVESFAMPSGDGIAQAKMRSAQRRDASRTRDRVSDGPSGTSSAFDILDVQVGPQGRSLKVFGTDPSKLKDKFKVPNLDSIRIPGIPNLETAHLIEEYYEIGVQLDSLKGQTDHVAKRADSASKQVQGTAEQATGNAENDVTKLHENADQEATALHDNADKEAIALRDSEIQRLQEQRRKLLKKLGMSEAEAQKVIETVKSVGDRKDDVELKEGEK